MAASALLRGVRMILVVGATGVLGGQVVRLLRDRGEAVRCLVRVATDDTALRALGAETVRGDLTDRASLTAACVGVDAIVATATVIARRLAGARRPAIKDVDEIGMAALVGAAEQAGVARFIYVSYAGAEASLGTPLERAKIATEQRLRRSSLEAVIVRPDAFQEVHLAPLGRFDIAAGKVSVLGRGDTRRRWVAVDDVAALIAALAVEADPPSMVVVGGPEALSRNEAIAVAERAARRRMKVQRMPAPFARAAMLLLARPNDALASVFGAGLVQDLQEATWDDAPLRARGITPRSATEFIEQQARAIAPDSSRSSGT
jgi:uncharacterized protein YbjT (DUF2867 family)